MPELASLKGWTLGQRQSTGLHAQAQGGVTALAHSGHLPIDNNLIERWFRSCALGRKNGLFAGSLKAGQR